MKTLLYINVIASMAIMLLAVWALGHEDITELQFIVTVLASVFTGVISLVEAESNY
jgi:hypothetical protein